MAGTAGCCTANGQGYSVSTAITAAGCCTANRQGYSVSTAIALHHAALESLLLAGCGSVALIGPGGGIALYCSDSMKSALHGSHF